MLFYVIRCLNSYASYFLLCISGCCVIVEFLLLNLDNIIVRQNLKKYCINREKNYYKLNVFTGCKRQSTDFTDEPFIKFVVGI